MSRHIWLRSLFTVLAGIAVGTLVGLSTVIFSDLPQVESLDRYRPIGVTTLRDIQGRTLHEFYRERRNPLTLSKIPQPLVKAFLVAEDWRFYDHFGVDLQGLLRAAVKNLFVGRYAEGASTITQQLAKVLFLTPEKTFRRKLKEAWLAIQIERRYGKDEILELYLNQIYLGAGSYGVSAAAQTYFGKNVNELTTAEAALLAALPKGPSFFSPFDHPERARERRSVVLRAMYERGLIRRDQWDAAREEPLPVKIEKDDRTQSYFDAYVLKLLSAELGEDEIYRGRLDVQTTLDLDLQRVAEAAVRQGIEDYAQRHHIDPQQTEKLPQGALLALDVATGEIRAMVGGRNFAENQFNRTVQAVRQPGSSFKPIVYAAAIERGYTQSSTLLDERIEFQNRRSGTWKPENYDGEYDGPIPLRVALEKSKNVATVRLLQALGVPTLKQMARRLGFVSPLASDLSIALGSSSVTLQELARAYATFASGGIRPAPRAIRSVKTERGADLWPPPQPSEPALEPAIAYIVTDLLSGVIRDGTGVFANDLSCAVAGKTGTTDDFVDAIFVGYNTRIVAVSWVGFDDRRTLGYAETGAIAAGPIWKMFMEKACAAGSSEFPRPSGVEMIEVDHSSGKRPGPYCTDVIAEAFLPATEPTEGCEEEVTSSFTP